MMKEYYAHSPQKGGHAQTYAEHVNNVVELAHGKAQNAGIFAKDGNLLADLTATVAYWHDLGKLHPANQPVLSGEKQARTLPQSHWDAGSALLREEQNPCAAWAVFAHHKGYGDLAIELLRSDKTFREEKEIDETDRLLDDYKRVHRDKLGGTKYIPPSSLPQGDRSVFMRILLSCLADADHSDTGRHYGNYPKSEPHISLRAAERLEMLDAYVTGFAANPTGNAERITLRGEMYTACRNAETEAAISSCDSPVGTGKTTAIMAHLLSQAQSKGLRRIFVVLPFTNIIEQSVEIYRKALVLPGENPQLVVAELHHRADFESEYTRHLTALWRAPIIVTTAVAFFETMAAASPAALRRLHELPGSAIFVDESHAALPANLLPVAWKWMNVFAHEWGCYWALASGSLCRFWQIDEIAQDKSYSVPEIINEDLRSRLYAGEQARITYRAELIPKSLAAAMDWISAYSGPRLVILNTVQNAATLAKAFADRFGRESVEHLSTSLTPHDRAKTLRRVYERLENKDDNDWSLIATSCVEAGVNLSFRKGFREIASLASLLQAAGRIGRNGEYPDAEMLAFTLDTSSVFNTNPGLNRSAEVLRRYFERNIPISAELSTDAVSSELKLSGESSKYKELLCYERNLCFKSVENNFHVIDNDSRLTIVNSDFASQVKSGKSDWRELQKHSVQIRRTILKKHRVKEIMSDIFLWELGYDDFLGYMQGALKLNDANNC